MFRVHQFNKVEQFSFTRPDESWDELERLLANTEEIAQALGLPYRMDVLPAGDSVRGLGEDVRPRALVSVPGRYREVASISNTTDFQSRRLNIRARDGDSLGPVHLLNGTAVTDRWLLAILENFGVEVPEVLREFGAPERIRRDHE